MEQIYDILNKHFQDYNASSRDDKLACTLGYLRFRVEYDNDLTPKEILDIINNIFLE